MNKQAVATIAEAPVSMSDSAALMQTITRAATDASVAGPSFPSSIAPSARCSHLMDWPGPSPRGW